MVKLRSSTLKAEKRARISPCTMIVRNSDGSRINNVFFIIDDEILKDRRIYNLSELEEQLTQDYLNEGAKEGYSSSPAYLFIRLKYTKENPKKLIELLDRNYCSTQSTGNYRRIVS